MIGVSSDDGVGGPAVVEHLVGVKETLVAEEVLEVAVVELGRGLEVERSQIVVAGAGGLRATGLPCFGQRRVNVALVVYPCPKVCAPSLPYCVSP